MVSRHFPKTHPRAGELTHFVQKILRSLLPLSHKPVTKIAYPAKGHTIRAGNRWKVGEMASIRIWTGLPYRSKQEEVCQVEIKKVWNVNITGGKYSKVVSIVKENSKYETLVPLSEVAYNDGLSNDDFINWFSKDFSGQIICWSSKIEY